ncbi:MAG: putative signal transducing protein [Bacteroidia bacterium]|jgi:hypothetical protein
MDSNWTLVLSDADSTRVKIIQNLLDSEGLTTSMIDHSDSSFPSNAESELYVKNEDADRAHILIEEFQNQ